MRPNLRRGNSVLYRNLGPILHQEAPSSEAVPGRKVRLVIWDPTSREEKKKKEKEEAKEKEKSEDRQLADNTRLETQNPFHPSATTAHLKDNTTKDPRSADKAFCFFGLVGTGQT